MLVRFQEGIFASPIEARHGMTFSLSASVPKKAAELPHPPKTQLGP